MKCISLFLTGREPRELFYTEGLQPLFDQQLPALDILYALFVIRDTTWQYPSPWHTDVYQIVPMDTRIVAEKDWEFQWLFILQSATEKVMLHVLIQTDSTNPKCYTHFMSSLRLIFSKQGSSGQATRCIQQLKEVLKQPDIHYRDVNCIVEGWSEDTTFHLLIEDDIRKLRWNGPLNQFMHPLES